MSQFTILWESQAKREIGAETQWSGDTLLLDCDDYKGFSLFDPEERRELWEYRPKGAGAIRNIHSGGDWIWAQGTSDIHAVKRSTGEGGPVNYLKPQDFFLFASDTHAIFQLSKGAAILDLVSGEASRCQDALQDLIPVNGCGSFFFARDRSSNFYTGRLAPDSGRLLKDEAKLMEEFQTTRGLIRLKACSAAFAFARYNEEGDLSIQIYSWSGKLLMEPVIRGYGFSENMVIRAEILLSPEGTLESLLVFARRMDERTPIFLLDLKNHGELCWATELDGVVSDNYQVLANRVCFLKPTHNAGCTGITIDLKDGMAAPFIDEQVRYWLASDGRGLFFGRQEKGRKHIAYGEFT